MASLPLSPAHPMPPLAHAFELLCAGEHSSPHSVLGCHPHSDPEANGGKGGVVVRSFHPDAVGCELLIEEPERALPMQSVANGGFEIVLPDQQEIPFAYALRFRFADGNSLVRGDPYRFLPTLGDLDLHLFGEGQHMHLWRSMGARITTVDGVDGVAFSVWAPNARRVSVIGDFCGWDGRLMPMRTLGDSGIFELFIPGLREGELYKYEIKAADGTILVKADPMAQAAQHPPATASKVFKSTYAWHDDAWLQGRRNVDWHREPMAIYEVHLGSWARVPEEENRKLTYRELAHRLVEHVRRLGFNFIELMPISEFPFDGSWGYQVSGYFAPTSRFGSPDDFRYFVDHCHEHGIGVIIDWVPAHFPKDAFALARFDGTALYEHEDPRRGEHPDWGTLIFNYGRTEVRNFLVANALYWLDEFHIDGLRVDAVASMLYLDYSRAGDEWLPNQYGGRENLQAVDFIRAFNDAVHDRCPGCFTVAEESTAWPGVTTATRDGGLGFTFKWNMGWMHDTLEFFRKDPVHRRYHQDQLTFAMIYEHTERFIMPLSHDEVVHGKGSLLGKMPGDRWQQLANLRLLYAYQFLRPGKKLLFMGAELAPEYEWRHAHSLDWHLVDCSENRGVMQLLSDLGNLYCEQERWLGEADIAAGGFGWIDCQDHDQSVLSFVRQNGEHMILVVMNMTPVPHPEYRVGAPRQGWFDVILNSDAGVYGGSNYPSSQGVHTDPGPWHGCQQSLHLDLPPLSALVLRPRT